MSAYHAHAQHWGRLSRSFLLMTIGCVVVAAIHCQKPSGLVVSVGTDLRVGDEVDTLSITVGREGGATEERSLPLAGTASLPATLGVDGDGVLVVTARALLRGRVVVERTARTTTTRDEERVLALDLCASCMGRACGAGATCTAVGCAPDAVDRADLPSWTGALPERSCRPRPPTQAPNGEAEGGASRDDAPDAMPSDAAAPIACPSGATAYDTGCVLVPGASRCATPVDVSSGVSIRGDFGGGEPATCTIDGSQRDVEMKVFRAGPLPPGVAQWTVHVTALAGSNVTWKKLPVGACNSLVYEGCVRVANDPQRDAFTLAPNESFAIAGRNGNGSFRLTFTP